jgi:hypothetical protein
MRDDDPWNLVLYNDSEVGPSVTQFANNLGQTGAGFPSPPAKSGPVPDLSSLLQAGLGSGVIAGLLPQLGGTSAASLSPAALAPSQPLQDPTPFELPEMTMDQTAMASGMSPEQVADIRNGAERQVGAQTVASDALAPPDGMCASRSRGTPNARSNCVIRDRCA